MKSDFERNLEKYAEVIVKVGLNIQPGQRLVIGPPYIFPGVELEAAPLVRLIAKKAYQAGARFVEVMWNDKQLELLRLQFAPRDSFEEYPTWRADTAIAAAKREDALLLLISPNDDLFADQDNDLIMDIANINQKHMKPFMDLRGKRRMNFAMAAAPIQGWADKVFPDLPPENRLAQLWDAVFEVCRVKDPDPVAAWHVHVSNLNARCDKLNSKKYSTLHFKASGTDLRIGLPDGHIWTGGTRSTLSGINFTSNIPTEEVFTLPHKNKVEGVVKLTKPFGSLEGLTLTFYKGKIVKTSVEQGDEDRFENWLEEDETFRKLGEVALVPHSTPISKIGISFHNLLFDENASCHLALGNGYRYCLEGGEDMSEEEFMAAGGNNSQIHMDFMIGSEEMDVDGIKDDGSIEPIMRGGEWRLNLD